VTYVSTYSYIAGSKDQWMPVNGARVTLSPGDLSYITDNLNNGFFIFDNLNPGTYKLKIEADLYQTEMSPELKVDSARITYQAFYLIPRSLNANQTGLRNSGESGITLFPCPARSEIYFKTGLMKGRYQVSDLSGRILIKGVMTENQGTMKIDIHGLISGVYILTLLTDGYCSYGRFLKQ
jgi:hypothetical protein